MRQVSPVRVPSAVVGCSDSDLPWAVPVAGGHGFQRLAGGHGRPTPAVLGLLRFGEPMVVRGMR